MAEKNIIYTLLIFAVLANVVLGLLVITRNRHERINKAFLALSVSVAGWIATNAIYSILTNNSAKFQIALVSYGFASMLAISFYVFSVALVRQVYHERRTLFLVIIIFSSIFGILSMVPGVVARAVHDGLIVTNALLLGMYGVSVLLPLVRSVEVWILARRRYRTQEKRKMNVIIVSFSLAAAIGVVCNLVFPLRGIYTFVAIGPMGSLLFVAGTAYAIAKNQLFDIHSFVLRAAAYLFTLFGMTFIFIAPFILIIDRLLGRTLTLGQFAFVVAASVVLLYILQFLRRFFDKMTTKIFFRHYYDPQDVLDKLSVILVRTADLKVLRNETAKVLQEALRPSMIRYILFTDGVKKDVLLAKRLDTYSVEHGVNLVYADEIGAKSDSLVVSLREEHVALAIKLQTTHEDLGFMVLGHKQSGEQYSEGDRRLLSVAADEIAISLQNVLRFEEIQRFNITLQEEIDAATRKLQRQNKRLEELDNIKDDFISMASHQLRTPLTSVKGYLSMVLEGDAGKVNPQQAKMLNQSFTSAQRMVFLITDLLNVSRLKTGKFIIDAAPVNLSATIQEEVEQLKETAESKNIALTYRKPKNFPELMLDEVKIRQVIMNFMDNAIYYTPTGGHIKVELIEKPSTIELRVVDDGIGVPRSEQHHLFTKFYRATNARKARPDGTGLGLFMAAKVISAQGGSIIFSSKEGKGSTFGFAFSKSRMKVHQPVSQPEQGVASVEPKQPAGVGR